MTLTREQLINDLRLYQRNGYDWMGEAADMLERDGKVLNAVAAGGLEGPSADDDGPDWTPEDSKAALAEGWDIFYTHGAAGHAPYELQAIGAPEDHHDLPYDKPIFTDEHGDVSDPAAWRHVVNNAKPGTLHQRALRFLQEHSPAEYKRVVRSA